MTDNPSFVLKKIDDVAFEQRPIPKIDPHEVLVAVKKTGICGSDVHYLAHGRIGDFIVNDPMVLGHESSGVVVKVGSEVKHLSEGTRVALEPGATCRVCVDCKAGRYQLCPNVVFAATPPYDGTLGRYYKLPGDLAYPLPDNMTLEDGAMIEPLAVGVHAVYSVGNIKANQNVAVFGAGPVGLLCMAVAKACGASRIIGVDIVQSRLDFARKYVATDVFLPPKPNDGESKIDYSKRIAADIAKQFNIPDRGESSLDLIIDASGAEACIQMGLFLVRQGGTYVQVGMGNPEVQIPVTLLLIKEVVFKGSFRYGPGDYTTAIKLVSSGKLDLKPLVTHRFAFDDAIDAFKATRAGKGADGVGVIKAIISGPDVDPSSK